MKNIFYFSIVAAVVALMASLSSNAYAQSNQQILNRLRAHHTNIKADIDTHDTTVKNILNNTVNTNILTHDGNMTSEHNSISADILFHDTGVNTKLDEILAAVQNGGSCSDAPVAKTGQTISYGSRDDGELKSGVAWPNQRFTDNGDGTITDNLTHLIWDKDANRFGMRTWASALTDCNNLASGATGLTDGSVAGDWHLANRFELESLLHMGFINPAVPDTLGTGQWSEGHPFNNVQLWFYWTSTTVALNAPHAWVLRLDVGLVDSHGKAGNSHFVWCVRGGQ